MKLDVMSYGYELSEVGAHARDAEDRGFDCWNTAETTHDSFLMLAMAALATERIELASGITVAFSRTPMTVAYAAQDLQRLSGGRLVLGLGTQVKPHITRRFSMPWSRPAARMHEFIRALHAIWDAWNERAPLRFEGEFYSHTLMTPFFSPEPVERRPQVYLAAVGSRMTRVAGELADGLLCHYLTSDRYLREVTLPALQQGIARAGRERADVAVTLPGMIVTGYDQAEREAAANAVRTQIGFYGSTPNYRSVLDLHGWGDLADELNRLSRSGGWAQMPDAIPDEVLDAFAVRAEPDELGPALRERYGGLVDRLGLPDALHLRDEHVAALKASLAA